MSRWLVVGVKDNIEDGVIGPDAIDAYMEEKVKKLY